MKVAIRTDASSMIGTGHVMRCKTLADELSRRGAEVRFVCRDHPGNLNELIRSSGYAVTNLPAPRGNPDASHGRDDYAAWLGVEQEADAAQTAEAIGDFAPDWLVVDHYGLDAVWEKSLHPVARRLLVIDDLANRPHDGDLLLDPNDCGAAEGRYRGLVGGKCRLLLGPRYALLQPMFSELRRSLPPREGRIQRLLLFFGGADGGNQTAKALQALQAPHFHDIAVDVVIGGANPRGAELERLVATRPGVSVHRQMPNLAGLMARADVMLGAGGTTSWERCCLGLPAAVVIASENQKFTTDTLSERGAHLNLGASAEVGPEAWSVAIRELTGAPDRVRAYAEAAAGITDGMGVLRVAAIMSPAPLRIKMRRASWSDESLLFAWANDPDVRRYSFSPQPISLSAHRNWFRGKLADPNCLLLIGEDSHGLPVGQVRFDHRDGEVLIDISVDFGLRGRGVGEWLLRKAIDVLHSEGCREPVVGEVLATNRASQRTFEKAGFRLVPSEVSCSDCLRFVFQT